MPRILHLLFRLFRWLLLLGAATALYLGLWKLQAGLLDDIVSLNLSMYSLAEHIPCYGPGIVVGLREGLGGRAPILIEFMMIIWFAIYVAFLIIKNLLEVPRPRTRAAAPAGDRVDGSSVQE